MATSAPPPIMSSLVNMKQEGILLESGTNEVEFIEFYLGSESYGVNVSKVVRVIALKNVEITPMPGANPAVRGVIYVQKQPVTLVDLRSALNVQTQGDDFERQLVLVLKFNQKTSAYLIDGINKIHRTSWENFKPMNESGFGSNGYTTGTITMDDKVVLILDVERIQLELTPSRAQTSLSSAQTDADKAKRRSDIKIVYAEDSGLIRKITGQVLAEGGYTNLKTFEDGQKALEYINQIREQAKGEGKTVNDYIDLIITDIEMPEMDGLTLCKRIKSEPGAESIPAVIIYSSMVNESMIKKCESVGADVQICKPINEELIANIDKMFGI